MAYIPQTREAFGNLFPSTHQDGSSVYFSGTPITTPANNWGIKRIDPPMEFTRDDTYMPQIAYPPRPFGTFEEEAIIPTQIH